MGHLLNFIVGWTILVIILFILLVKCFILWDWGVALNEKEMYGDKVWNDMMVKWNK